LKEKLELQKKDFEEKEIALNREFKDLTNQKVFF